MEIITTLRSLADRLEAIEITGISKDANALLDWVDSKGFGYLETSVRDYLVEKKYPLNEETQVCLNQFLGEWKLVRHIDAGVYEIRKGTERQALKISSDSESYDEVKATQIASQLGVGPKFWDAVECKVDPSKNDYTFLIYIRMGYIDGETLATTFTRPLEYDQFKGYVDGALTAYDALLRHGIKQGDPHAHNFMATKDHVYIIDFGLATVLDQVPTGDERYDMMKSMIGSFVSSVNREWVDNKGGYVGDIEFRTQYWIYMATAVREWFLINFPSKPLLRISHIVYIDPKEPFIDETNPDVKVLLA
ncbi:Hypothetical protein POVN_LOCUS58 [uncultured virus]|nr:Hypothetical protein POVN_LOCUS58 [uncultured virus]